MSPKSAGLAKKWGYADVKVYSEGAPGWKQKGHYLISTPGYVNTANIVLVDLRGPAQVRAGHIPGAVGIPLDSLSESRRMFPTSMVAPIVFYAGDIKESVGAVKIASQWGYKNVTLFPFPGAREWLAEGFEIRTGPAAQKIHWVRKRGPGEISLDDFEAALNSGAIEVIDVRGNAEYEAGHFPGAINIPLDSLPQRLDEIPKDKFIVVHCKTGVRGEMAYLLLKEKGYAVKYLNANCKCKPDGTYWLWE
ncbi:MAG: rhodanese [Deltaproteobacteria bacterium]|nr:rhodanese [Deltaproteobacteria bacterium]MCF8119865.1 rhodanese [Deltaproteobacteria bacterium]